VPLKAFSVWNTERPEQSIKGLEKEIGSVERGQLFPKLIVKKYTYLARKVNRKVNTR
jgi:hypothetical protein